MPTCLVSTCRLTLRVAALATALALFLPATATARARAHASTHRGIVRRRGALKSRNKSSSGLRRVVALHPARAAHVPQSPGSPPQVSPAPLAEPPLAAPPEPAVQPEAEDESGHAAEGESPNVESPEAGSSPALESDVTPTFESGSGTQSTSGAVVAVGRNDAGQVGAGYFGPHPALGPETTLLPPHVKQLSSGGGFTLALLENGTVMSWGDNFMGPLGNGTKVTDGMPRLIPGLTGVRQVAAGGQHAAALLNNGTVETWGGNLFGQLGDGQSGQGIEAQAAHLTRLVPGPVPGLEHVVAISASPGCVFAIQSGGTLKSWGEAPCIGDGTGVEKDVPTTVPLRGVVEVVSGGEATLGSHVLARLAGGIVMAWGDGQDGQLGIGSLPFKTNLPVPVPGAIGAVQVAASMRDSAALLANGTVLTWGANNNGQDGTTAGQITCGRGLILPCIPHPVPVLHGASEIATGWDDTFAVNTSHQLFAWGLNEYGELGTGDLVNRPAPALANVSGVTAVTAGPRFTLATIMGAGPPPVVTMSAGREQLTITWTAPAQTEGWRILYQPLTNPATPLEAIVPLPATTRSYTVTGLHSGVLYGLTLESPPVGPRSFRAAPL